ncbi:MAG: hypothetical protein IGS39_14365 [Calothrix sp. C42_A2020_038]|nr:hypothetical protein [Calothrix sp. C42_A2020_038]
MTQTNLKPEAFIEDFHPAVVCQVIHQNQELELNPDNALAYKIYEGDIIVVKSEFVRLRFLYSGNSITLRTNLSIPGEATSYVIEKDTVPSFFSQVRESLFNFFEGTSQIQKATYPPLVTKGKTESDRESVFPPDDCHVQRHETLVFAWNLELHAPKLEISWEPNGDFASSREYQIPVSELLELGDPVSENQEVILNWNLSDRRTNFNVEGKIIVIKASESFQTHLMQDLTQDEQVRWQVGEFIQNKFYIDARNILTEYLTRFPNELQQSVFLQKSAKLLTLINY